jgi:DNA-binding NarL/FixJ family response regulator
MIERIKMGQQQILIVDDHAMLREGIRLLLDKHRFPCELLEASSCDEALKCLERNVDVNWILLDLGLPDISGIDALQLLRKHFPSVPVVVLSGTEDRAQVLECINRGAMGFIAKSCDSVELVRALRVVFDGGVYLPTGLFGQVSPARLVAAASVVSTTRRELSGLGLTPRQIEVIGFLVQGLPNKSIAKRLDLSEATVKTHVAAGLRALNVKNRTQAVFAVAKMGLLRDSVPLTADRE